MKNFLSALLAALAFLVPAGSAEAVKPTTAREIRTQAYQSLAMLHVEAPETARLGREAYAALVFPEIRGFGFLGGFEHGHGVLFMNRIAVDYYNLHAVSGGAQIGWRKFGYAIFFMTEKSFDKFIKTKGIDIGINATATVDSGGFSVHKSNTTLVHDTIEYIFDEDGMMFRLGLQFNRITEAHPKQ